MNTYQYVTNVAVRAAGIKYVAAIICTFHVPDHVTLKELEQTFEGALKAAKLNADSKGEVGEMAEVLKTVDNCLHSTSSYEYADGFHNVEYNLHKKYPNTTAAIAREREKVRLIDGNKLADFFDNTPNWWDGIDTDEVVRIIDREPTIEAEPVVHGRWDVIQVNGTCTTFACSVCSREEEARNDYFGKPTEHIAKIYPYCHCGAKMDLKD